MEKLLKHKSFHLFVKIIGFTIIFCSVALLLINVIYGNVLNVKGLNKKLGSFGEYGTILAASLWFLRHVWLFFKKKNIIGVKLIKDLYLFIKKFHVLIGYTVLAVSITHGVYFLLKGSRHILIFYSGIFSLFILIILGVIGLFLQKHNKKINLILYRKVHQIMAIIFGVGLLIHLTV